MSEPQLEEISKKLRRTSIRSKNTAKMLRSHVDECARMQKRVLLVGAATLAWVVTHSPEAARLFGTLLEAFL